jgi:predicted ATPase
VKEKVCLLFLFFFLGGLCFEGGDGAMFFLCYFSLGQLDDPCKEKCLSDGILLYLLLLLLQQQDLKQYC